MLFTDWQGDADEQLTGEPGSDVLEVFGGADERGVDVRGLVWRSHLDQTGFFATENRHFGEQLQHRGAEVLLDMRVRTGGSHHQKLVVVRHRDDPSRDVAWIGGIDLAHNRRDDHRHLGDPQSQPLAEEYGDHPPWHDVQVRIQGPAVHAVETVFRERWEDPTPLSRNPIRRSSDLVRRLDMTPTRCPSRRPRRRAPGATGCSCSAPTPTCATAATTRSPAAASGAWLGATPRPSARRVAWSTSRTSTSGATTWPSRSSTALREHPDLRVIVVIPLFPDVDGRLSRPAELLARSRALDRLLEAAPDRVAAYGLENHAGTPVYVHAKVCVMDDLWASVGSDNFNRRSWTHDSELSCVVLDDDYSRSLRLRLAAEHLDRLDDVGDRGLDRPWTTSSTRRDVRRLRRAAARSTPGTRAVGGVRDRRDSCDASRSRGRTAQAAGRARPGPRARPRRPARPAPAVATTDAAGAGRGRWRRRGRGASYALARR